MNTIPHVIWAMEHGYRCWSELHRYGGRFAGSWREWLCGLRGGR